MMLPIRRRLVVAAAAVAAASGLVAPAARAQAPTEVRIGYALAVTSHYGAAAVAWADAVEKSTAGRFRFKAFPNSALGGEREMVEGLTLGTLDAAIVSTGTLANFVPEVGVVDIPFLFRDAKHARAVLDGPIGDELLAKFSARGLKAVAWGEQGFRHLTNSRRAVGGPKDFDGLKIRTMENPVHIAAFRALGAQPTPMAWPEVVTALQQGTIDGQENPISVIVSAKLAQTQKHLTLTGHVYSPAVLFLSQRFWDGLAPADRDAFARGAKIGVVAMRAFVDSVEKNGAAELKAQGMQIVEHVDHAAFQKALEPAYADYRKRFDPALIERIRAAR